MVRPWSAVLHTALGLLLGVFVVFHAVQNYPAVTHADAWTERALETSLGFTFGLIVLGAVIPHAILGFASFLRYRAAVARSLVAPDWGVRYQLVTGLVVMAFIAFHVMQLWPSGGGMHASVRDPYARLWNELGRPLPLAIYVVGVTAVAFHLGHGFARVLGRGRSIIPGIVARIAGGLLGFILLLLFVQIVARFALGEALIPALS